MFLHAEAERVCNTALFVTGNGRSGTTILGKLIHSLADVEYAFEPPVLFTLLPMIERMPRAHFKIMFETYCYEDQFVGQLTGRAFNFNRNDDSCVFLTKAREEIDARLTTAWRKQAVAETSARRRLAIKIPDATCYVPALHDIYPGMTFIVSCRQPDAVIDSVIGKAWFTDSVLHRRDIIWPSLTPDFTTPVWVEEDYIRAWRTWSELERAGYYYLRLTGAALGVGSVIYISYERLVSEPGAVVAGLAERLGLSLGEKTNEIIEETYARTDAAPDWTSQLPRWMRARMHVMSGLAA